MRADYQLFYWRFIVGVTVVRAGIVESDANCNSRCNNQLRRLSKPKTTILLGITSDITWQMVSWCVSAI